MKTTAKPHTLQRRQQITSLALNIGLLAGLTALPLHAQEDENIPAGYSEEEWYDPGDWADGDDIERTGSDWWDNVERSDSADDNDNSSNLGGYDKNRNPESNNQARRNPQQNRSDSQMGRNSRQNRSDSQMGGRNQRQDRGDSQMGRNQKQDRANPQTGWSQQPDRGDRNQQAKRNQEQSMKEVTFSGKVDGFKNVNVKTRKGRDEEHTFVRLRLNNDEARVVSLGSRLILTDLDLEQDDQISVTGRKARIDDREILVASTIEVDDTLFRIRKDNRPETGRSFPIEGTVREVSMTSLSDDSREKNLLVRLEMKDGKTCVVDLGKGTTLGDLDIEQGSEIRLHGKKTKVDGKSLIVARKISVDGDTTRVRNMSKQGRARPNNMESWEYSQQDSNYQEHESVSRD